MVYYFIADLKGHSWKRHKCAFDVLSALFSSTLKADMTTLLEKNRPILQQITTLSLLMVNLSSCITFDRYRGYNSTEELDSVAQDLAKNRDLYASE